METENDFGVAPAVELAAPPAPFADVAASADAVASVLPETVVREVEARRRTSESRLESLDQIWDGLERIQAELEAQELATPPLLRELGATQERVQARKQQHADEIAALEHVREEVERQSLRLDELRSELTAKIGELSELKATAASWNARVAGLEAEVASLGGRADDVARGLAALAGGSVHAPALEARPRPTNRAAIILSTRRRSRRAISSSCRPTTATSWSSAMDRLLPSASASGSATGPGS